MILIERNDAGANVKGGQIIALFGAGLIGGSILKGVSRLGPHNMSGSPFTWNAGDLQVQELDIIRDRILALRKLAPTFPAFKIDIIWAAGRAGFSSSLEHIIPEMDAFKNVLGFARDLSGRAEIAGHSFHLISSAGGLHEGQRRVDSTSRPRPMRPYSYAKLEQERLLMASPPRIRKMIYRLSSVYGFSERGGRLGLINTIIHNSIRHRPSNIFGNALTIRDYILAADIGTFVANQVFGYDMKSRTFTLASGKPTTIFEILNRLEKIMHRKLLLKFDTMQVNATHISFSPSILPRRWYPTDLETGLRQTVSFLTNSTLALR